MPELHIEKWPVERLRPYERNPRKNDHVVSKMVDALRQFGFRVPLLAKSARILVALDADEDKPDGSNPGAEAWPGWRQTYPQARLWPVPVGKDPGEAFALGVDLAEWIAAATPSSPVSTGSAVPPANQGEVIGSS